MGRTRRGQHGPWSARHGGGHGARRHSEQQQVSTRCTGRVGELLGASQQRASGRGPQRATQVQGPPCTRCSEERLLRVRTASSASGCTRIGRTWPLAKKAFTSALRLDLAAASAGVTPYCGAGIQRTRAAERGSSAAKGTAGGSCARRWRSKRGRARARRRRATKDGAGSLGSSWPSWVPVTSECR